jgi:hypothetical protein
VALAAVFASMFWPWTSSGSGSSVPGHRLASLILEGRADLWVPRWVGAALFLVPLAGSIGLATLVGRGRVVEIARVGAVVIAAAVSICVLAALHKLSLAGLGPGGALALFGSLAAGVCVAFGRKDWAV